jgi:ABC-type multidrug transport system ATPase subunit
MSLLELDCVGKAFGRGAQRRVVLRNVSLELAAGEVVAVWGMRRSGRSTLLRVAAGIEQPDGGTVRYDGADLAARGGDVLGGGIGYCRKSFRRSEGELVIDHLTVGQLARGVAPALAWKQARAALERTGAAACATRRPNELDGAESVQVAIARAIALQPRVLLVDEPTIGVDLLARDTILLLLRSLADDGLAVLMSTGESTGLTGSRALSLSDGELHGVPAKDLAPVIPLRRSA